MGLIAKKLVKAVWDANDKSAAATVAWFEYDQETLNFLKDNPLQSPAFFEAREKKSKELEKKAASTEAKLKLAMKAASVFAKTKKMSDTVLKSFKSVKDKLKKLVK